MARFGGGKAEGKNQLRRFGLFRWGRICKSKLGGGFVKQTTAGLGTTCGVLDSWVRGLMGGSGGDEVLREYRAWWYAGGIRGVGAEYGPVS